MEVELSELWNFMIWYNGMYAWFTLNSDSNFFYSDIYKAWMFVEYEKHLENWIDRTYEEALRDELQDRPWYDAWYKMAKSEIRNKWWLQEWVINLKDSIKTWITNSHR